MIGLLGKEILILKCSSPAVVGLKGTLMLESMHMLTMSSGSRTLTMPKKGTVFQLAETGRVVIGEELEGRLTDRLARGSKI